MAHKPCHAWGAALALTVLMLVSVPPSFAAQTGKIAGTITDASTNQPIAGAAVVIKGTRIGATTDADGRYFLINILPGNYTLVISLVGYQQKTVEDVSVNIDRTTPISEKLQSASIQVGGVTVVAPRQIVQLDVSGSKTTIEPQDIAALPTPSLKQALALQPGVGVNGSIRAGSLDQTQVIVDGHLAVDQRNNVPIMTVPTTDLQEVQILTGGFEAQYGNARSGIINVVTRDAVGKPLWGALNAEYTPAQKKFYEPDGPAFGPGSYEWREFGTSTTDTIMSGSKLVFAGWDSLSRNASANPNGLTPQQLLQQWQWQHRTSTYANKPDYVVDASLGVPINPMFGAVVSFRRLYEEYAIPQPRSGYGNTEWSAKINIRPTQALRIDLRGMYDMERGMGATPGTRGLTSTIYEDVGPSINFLSPTDKYSQWTNSLADFNRWGLTADFTYSLNRAAYINGGIDFSRYTYGIGPGAPVQDSVKQIGNAWLSSLPVGYLGTNQFDGTWMTYQIGGGANSRDSSNWNSVRVTLNYTNQVDERNLIKAGYEGIFTTINEFGGTENNAGFQMQQFKATPAQNGLFVQDKIEYQGMIAHVGLRLDAFNSNGTVFEPNNAFSHIFDHGVWGNVKTDFNIAKTIEATKYFTPPGGGGVIDTLHTQAATAKYYLSPRIGISHPISKTTKVFFNYGHFYSMPQFQYVYGMYPNQPGAVEYIANPDLQMPRTIAYELGFDQELFGQYLLHIAGYYKDATNEISTLQFQIVDPQGTTNQLYTVTTPYNNGQSDIRGFEFAFSKEIGKFVTGFINGGLEIRTSRLLGYSLYSDDPNSKPIPELPTVPQGAQPYSKLNVDLHTPAGYSAFGLPSIATDLWSLSWLTSYQKGASAIYDPVNGNGLPNAISNGSMSLPTPLAANAYVTSPNVRFKDYWMTDVRLTKGFKFGEYVLSAYLDVYNLFGYKVWTGAMRTEDYQAYMKSLHLPSSDPSITATKGNDKVGDTPSYAVLPVRDQWSLYAYPRSFAFGVKVDF